MENIVLEYADSYGITIERNVEVSQWNNGREIGTLFIASKAREKDSRELPRIKWTDLNKMGIWTRKIDGSFAGCRNSAWYITQDEADALIALDNERTAQHGASRPAREAAEAELERKYESLMKMMDDDAEPYC